MQLTPWAEGSLPTNTRGPHCVLLLRDPTLTGLCNHFTFHFLRNCQTVFQSDHTIFTNHQRYISVPISPHRHRHWLLSVIFPTAILVGVSQYLTVGLMCISLMTHNVEHLFMCRWSFTYFFGEMPVNIFALLFHWEVYHITEW